MLLLPTSNAGIGNPWSLCVASARATPYDKEQAVQVQKFLHILYVQLSEKMNIAEANVTFHVGPSSTLQQNAYQHPVMSFYRVCSLLSVTRCHMNLTVNLSSSSVWNCCIWYCTATVWYHESQIKIFLWLKFSHHWVNLRQKRLFQ